MITLIANVPIRFVNRSLNCFTTVEKQKYLEYGNTLILDPPYDQSFRIASTYLM